MPGAEAHIIARSQGGIHMMTDYFTDITLANSDDGLCRESGFLQTKRKPNRITCRITEKLQLQSRITNESQFQFGDPSYSATELEWQSTTDMIEKSSTEQRIFKEGDSRVYTIKSYRRVNSPPGGSLPRSRLRSLLRVDQDSTEAAYRERNDEVDRMVTEADFQRRRLVKQHLRVNATYR
jgi:hypothetical protein